MKRSSLRILLPLVSLLLACPATAPSAAVTHTGFDLNRTRSVHSDLIQKRLRETRAPSISIAVVRGDSIVWKAAFGYSNLHTKAAATPETLYNAGSTFKAVTATVPR